jgi:signal peptidase
VSSDRSAGGKEKKKLSPGMQFLRDAGVALLFVVTLLLAMYAYTGLWPPLVVVESSSMMHTDDNTSSIGVIDTGDLVLVKDIDSSDDIVTYLEGVHTDYSTYGDYGDVIVYKINGDDSRTPIIHRAMAYLELNPGGASYTCEALQYLERGPNGKWDTADSGDEWDSLTSTLYIYRVGYKHQTVTIRIDRISNSDDRPGFVTKGDHNNDVDLFRLVSGPIPVSWVVGEARGEIPWFGLLKLWASGGLEDAAPSNSVRNLWIAMALIVVAPVMLDVVLTFRIRRRIARKREAAVQEHEAAMREQQPTVDEKNLPGGPPPQVPPGQV